MNVLNWIQQERKVADYHVVTWHTSHFHHPKNRTDIVANITMKPRETGAAAASSVQTQPESIGFGTFDQNYGKYKSGGFGTDGLAIDGEKEAVNNKVISTSRNSQGNQVTGPEAAATVVQSLLPAEVYSVVESARQSVIKVQSRIKQSTAKLKDIYGKQSGQTVNTQKPLKMSRRQPEKEQRGTRPVSKEEVLSMQAENHYLLDSYDKNGQYSTLGK
ncbi:MAG: hypothetical protein J1F42_10770 [Lachnospiraceae bacterium]|nr:hypothetical protein [Lachnospiraceae bacterium]